jgi:hypothetical protein
LSAWQIREESHLERPWLDAYKPDERRPISDDLIRQHFKEKFACGKVVAPRYLPGAGSAALDGLPQLRARSLHELAVSLA